MRTKVKESRKAHEGNSGVRRLLKSGIIGEVRAQDLTSCSDAELQAMAGEMRLRGSGGFSDVELVQICGVLKETINRRLGAWRLFDPVTPPVFDRYRCLANQLLESGRYVADDPGVDEDQQLIVETMAHVTQALQNHYASSILLAGRFYQALARKDAEGVLAFHVTDEQVMAGILLYKGSIVEMASGEGKTVAAAFPAVLHALSGRTVHIITSNDYLASRDAGLLGAVYQSLDLAVDTVLGSMDDEERRSAYGANIVYSAIREVGFDFLRDNLKLSCGEQVQTALDVAIFDEADHALIDEAKTPMIIGDNRPFRRRLFSRIKRAVEELIDSQDKLCSDLLVSLRSGDLPCKERNTRLAQVMMAQPLNTSLKQLLAEDPQGHKAARGIVDQASADVDGDHSKTLYYVIDGHNRFVSLTARGLELLEARLGDVFDAGDLEAAILTIDREADLRLRERRRRKSKLVKRLCRQYEMGSLLYQMLRAYLLLPRDVDYMVSDDAVVLIDKNTGRPRADNRYLHGVQVALEAKEEVPLRPESETLGQISVLGLVRQYREIAGLTGTALSSQDEFQEVYGLDLAVVPPSRPSMRIDSRHRVYSTRQDKLEAILDEVRSCQRVGRPVLIGTTTIEQSWEVSRLLSENGVSHGTLNASNSEDEDSIVANAGRFGAVTVATNIAGRGTDIIVEPGLNQRVASEFAVLLHMVLSQGANSVHIRCDGAEEADILRPALAAFSLAEQQHEDGSVEFTACHDSGRASGADIYLEFGLGLYVLGTELNQSTRIDQQLRGRSGRQGEFGLSRFYLSLEDRLLVEWDANARFLLGGMKTDPQGRLYSEWKEADRQAQRAQLVQEREDQAQRRAYQDYSSVLDSIVIAHFHARQEIVESPQLKAECTLWTRQEGRSLVERYLSAASLTDYRARFDQMAEEALEDYHVDCSIFRGAEVEDMGEEVSHLLIVRLDDLESLMGADQFHQFVKLVRLQTLDELWKVHLSQLEEIMMGVQQGAHSHSDGVAEYAIRVSQAWRDFQQQAIGEFLCRLFSLALKNLDKQPALVDAVVKPDLVDDVAMILA